MEACGVVEIRRRTIVDLRAVQNVAGTPERRFLFGEQGQRVVMLTERNGRTEVGIYHSHPASAAFPSETDRSEMKATWPGVLQLMVSLATDPPDIKAYRIDRDGNVTREELTLLD